MRGCSLPQLPALADWVNVPYVACLVLSAVETVCHWLPSWSCCPD